MFPIELLGVKTNPAKSARNLGVIFDKNFTFHSAVCRSCSYHMQDLRRICRHLDLGSTKFFHLSWLGENRWWESWLTQQSHPAAIHLQANPMSALYARSSSRNKVFFSTPGGTVGLWYSVMMYASPQVLEGLPPVVTINFFTLTSPFPRRLLDDFVILWGNACLFLRTPKDSWKSPNQLHSRYKESISDLIVPSQHAFNKTFSITAWDVARSYKDQNIRHQFQKPKPLIPGSDTLPGPIVIFDDETRELTSSQDNALDQTKVVQTAWDEAPVTNMSATLNSVVFEYISDEEIPSDSPLRAPKTKDLLQKSVVAPITPETPTYSPHHSHLPSTTNGICVVQFSWDYPLTSGYPYYI